MKDEDIKLPELDEAVLQFHEAGEPPKIWDHIAKWAVSQAGIKASSLANNIDLSITEAMQEYARQAVRMNLEGDKSIIQQARAWEMVHNALSMVRPGWYECAETGQDAAVKTILDLGAKTAAAQPKPSGPEPFDLARAMAGEPIVTRDGRKARFLAHVPEFEDEGARVLVLVDGDKWVSHYFETGSYGWQEGIKDLFMAPKPKRTVWVNAWARHDDGIGISHPAYETEKEARKAALELDNLNHVAIAHPIEIDATE